MTKLNHHPLYQKMNDLYDRGDVKHAALVGIQLLEAHNLVELVSPSIYEVIFDNKEKKSFYIYVVSTIVDYAENQPF